MEETLPTENNLGTEDGTDDVVKIKDSQPTITKRKSSFNQ